MGYFAHPKPPREVASDMALHLERVGSCHKRVKDGAVLRDKVGGCNARQARANKFGTDVFHNMDRHTISDVHAEFRKLLVRWQQDVNQPSRLGGLGRCCLRSGDRREASENWRPASWQGDRRDAYTRIRSHGAGPGTTDVHRKSVPANFQGEDTSTRVFPVPRFVSRLRKCTYHHPTRLISGRSFAELITTLVRPGTREAPQPIWTDEHESYHFFEHCREESWYPCT